jgi:hypothetical protein
MGVPFIMARESCSTEVGSINCLVPIVAGWRTLRSVVPNYLSTFTSRYRDRDGWWLFGLAESSLDGLVVDLLSDAPHPVSPCKQVEHDAIYHFADQMRKHDVSPELLVKATLQCRRGDAGRRMAGDYLRDGHAFTFTACVRTSNGHEIERNRRLFVSPHDPRLEGQASGA